MNKLTKAAMLALVAASLATVSATAANVTTSPTDLILGFQVNSGAGLGSTTNLEIDLGSSSLFTTTATLSLNQLAVADLTSTYGANWATRGDLTWGVAGITSTAANSFDVTFSGANPQNASSLAVVYGNVSQLVGGVSAGAQTANSASATKVGDSTTPASGIAASWTAQENNGLGNADFGYFNPSGVTEVNGNNGNPVGSINLASFNEVGGKGNKPASVLGSFSLGSDGGLTYTGINAAAVPEPSAYALGICAVLLFVVLKRRHSVA